MAGAVNCFVRMDDATAFQVSGFGVEPFYAGWRGCTESEAAVVRSAELCAEP